MNKLKNTKKSAAFDRSSLIINLFREFPNNKFSLKHLASASGGATKEGRLRTREIITELLAQGTIEECGQEKYRLSGKERPRQEGIVQMSGIEGISFCHASRFLITAKDKETALAACRQVLKNNGRI